MKYNISDSWIQGKITLKVDSIISATEQFILNSSYTMHDEERHLKNKNHDLLDKYPYADHFH